MKKGRLPLEWLKCHFAFYDSGVCKVEPVWVSFCKI